MLTEDALPNEKVKEFLKEIENSYKKAFANFQ